MRKFSALFSLMLIYSTLLLLISTHKDLTAAENPPDHAETLVLPLKIHSLATDESFTRQVDLAASTAFTTEGFGFIDRKDAAKILDYEEAWPPAVTILRAQSTLAKYAYVIAGNLTLLGEQIRIDLKLFDLLTSETPSYFSAVATNVDELNIICKGLTEQIVKHISRQDFIASIAPVGNQKIDSGAILKNISSKPGDTYDPLALRKDLRSIFKMGYFDDIHIEVTTSTEGKAVLFHVIEKPVITKVTLSGLDELKEEDLLEVMKVKNQEILNTPMLSRDREAIEVLYRSKGYFNTKVDTQISYPTKDSATVTFVINEGDKIYIKDIQFEGNSTFDDEDLLDEMETCPKGFFSFFTSSGLLDQDTLNQDAGRIITFYGNHGFLDAKISDPIITQEEEWLYITFAIEEGTQYKVGKIDIEGDLITDKKELLASLSLPEQTYISRTLLRQDILKITDTYAEKGYANAIVQPNIQKGSSSDILDITVDIKKGELVYINRINIIGNTKTRDNVIRRNLKIEEGGIFNTKALRQSVQKLQFLEFFENVNINPEPSFVENKVDLTIEVKEKSTGQFMIGAGYSSVDHLVFMGEIANTNFLGRGDTLSFSTNIGGDSNLYNLKYKNPSFMDSSLSWSTNFFKMQREYDDYTKDSKGGSLQFGYPLWGEWRGYGSYSYTDTDLSDIDEDASYKIKQSADIHITSAVNFDLTRDTRDRQYGPSSGSRHTISLTYAGGPLRGDSEFTKIEGSTSWYFPLFLRTTFHFKGSAGQVFENEDDKLPVYERFYLGGLRSIRGFDYADVSPKDPDTKERIGGDKMWYTNFEFIFPLLEDQGVKGLIFYDMGMFSMMMKTGASMR